MRAVQWLGDGKLRIADVPRPEADDLALVLKVKASAICGSELGRFRAPADQQPAGPCNTGHEVAGVVAEAPPGSGLAPGDRVGARIVQGCGDCDFCRQGYETACPDRCYYGDSGHAEYFRLGIQGAHRLPDDCDWPAAAILSGDGLGVPTRAARRLGDTAGKHVLVLGLGPVGLSNVLVQAWRGARVMGIDLFDYRVQLAQELGAETAVQAGEGQDLVQAVRDWTAGRGADIVILAAGREQALHTAFELVCQQGTVYQVGEMSKATINPSALFIIREATLTGSWYYTSSDWPDMLAAHEAGMPYHKLITHTFPVEQAQEAYDTFISGASGKVVLTYE